MRGMIRSYESSRGFVCGTWGNRHQAASMGFISVIDHTARFESQCSYFPRRFRVVFLPVI
jgi:hypothetical protein